MIKNIFRLKTLLLLIIVGISSGSFISGSTQQSDSFIKHQVTDATPPLITGPSDKTFAKGGWVDLAWHYQDTNPGNYTIYKNGTITNEGSLTNNIIIEITAFGLGVGVYNYTFEAEDSFGNKATDLVYVTVFFEGEFSITSPLDITYEYGAIEQTIEWIATIPNLTTYEIFRNEESIRKKQPVYDGASILIYVTSLAVGTHNFTIVLTDDSNFTISDTVLVTVIGENIKPILNSPPDFIIEFGSTDNKLDWVGSDQFPADYTVTKNNEIYDTGVWFSIIRIYLDDLPVGIYDFELTIADQSGNTESDTVTVTVTGDETTSSSTSQSVVSSITKDSSSSQSSNDATIPFTNFIVFIISIIGIVFLKTYRRKN